MESKAMMSNEEREGINKGLRWAREAIERQLAEHHEGLTRRHTDASGDRCIGTIEGLERAAEAIKALRAPTVNDEEVAAEMKEKGLRPR